VGACGDRDTGQSTESEGIKAAKLQKVCEDTVRVSLKGGFGLQYFLPSPHLSANLVKQAKPNPVSFHHFQSFSL
jgi:hypothetical protein